MHTKTLTEGRPLPLIIRFAIPLMIGNFFQQVYTIVDAIVVSMELGVDALERQFCLNSFPH